MIVTCPSCTTRFKVSPVDLGEEGRTVRCGECAFEWFQPPEQYEEEEETADFSEELENILEEDREEIAEVDFVDPVDSMPPPRPREERIQELESSRGGHKGGRMAAAMLFLFALSGLWFMKPTITKAWPATHVVYSVFGKDAGLLDLNDISFERFEAVQEGHNLKVSGLIYNLRKDEITLPPLLMMLKASDGHVVRELIFTPDQPVIPAEDTLPVEQEIALNHDESVSLVEMRPLTFLDTESEKPVNEMVAGATHGEEIQEGHSQEHHEEAHH